MELLLLGEPISAERAKEIGFVWKICEPEGLMEQAVSLAEQLCQSAPLAVRATKEVATRTQNMGWTEAVRFGETMRIVANRAGSKFVGRESRRTTQRSAVYKWCMQMAKARRRELY